MLDETTLAAIFATVDPTRVLELEQALIRIPSSTFEEQAVADFLADISSGSDCRSRRSRYRTPSSRA